MLIVDSSFLDLGTIQADPAELERWKSGELPREWAAQWPELFDADDLRLARNHRGSWGHYFEWLGAIHLHQETGYHALVEKYEFRNHARKLAIVERLLPADVLDVVRDQAGYGSAQAPDLLLYSGDLSDFFFCEVKGPRDSLSPAQRSKFTELARRTNNPVRLLAVRWAAASTV